MFPCAFSPDGRRLVFAQLEGQYSQLFLLDMESRLGVCGKTGSRERAPPPMQGS